MSANQQTDGSGYRESERFALITGYPDNHCLITRYPDNRYEIPSTSVEIALQISSFMQNKPKVKYIKMNVSSYMTSKYEILDNWLFRQTNPKQSQFKPNLSQLKPISMPIKAKTNPIFTPLYRMPCILRGQTQFAERTKLIHSVYIQRIKNKNADRSYEKTNPISKAEKRTKEAKKKKRASGTFLRLWVAGKIDFLDGCDIILGKSQFNLFWRLIL